jgi:nucleotide-binding universal stress UspA family protein
MDAHPLKEESKVSDDSLYVDRVAWKGSVAMIGSQVLAGFQPDRRGEDALALAGVVLRHTRGSLTVASVRPPAGGSAHTEGRVDAEWHAYLDDQARAALRGAEATLQELGLPGDTQVGYLVGANRGSGRGLSALARRTRSDLIVIGSSPAGPRNGISIGSTADQLLHGSTVPVLVAPKNYAALRLEGFDRITVAFLRRHGCGEPVGFAAQIAAAREVPLRLLTIAVEPAAQGRAARLAEAEQRRLVDRYEAELALAAKEAAEGSALAPEQIETEVVQGPDVAQAVATTYWSPGEALVIASSETGPLRKVFVGDMSLKILRAVPCPTVVLPRLIPH